MVQIPRLMGCPGLKCEYAKSSRSSCRMCEEKIAQGEVRLALERPMDDRPNIMVPKWFHRRCFMEGIQTEKYNDVPLEFIMPQHFEGWEEQVHLQCTPAPPSHPNVLEATTGSFVLQNEGVSSSALMRARVTPPSPPNTPRLGSSLRRLLAYADTRFVDDTATFTQA